MKKSVRRPHIPFIETLWNHSRWVEQDVPRRSWRDEEEVESVLQKHWGRWETCRKCQAEGTVGCFENYPTFRGAVVYGLGIAATLGVILGVASLLP